MTCTHFANLIWVAVAVQVVVLDLENSAEFEGQFFHFLVQVRIHDVVQQQS